MTEKGQIGMEGMLPSQVIVVTGGGQGIGKAVALGAAAEGARSQSSTCMPKQHRQSRQILDLSGRAVACPADMSASDSNARVFDRAEAELGPVTGLVCAGRANDRRAVGRRHR